MKISVVSKIKGWKQDKTYPTKISSGDKMCKSCKYFTENNLENIEKWCMKGHRSSIKRCKDYESEGLLYSNFHRRRNE